jgi:hypothetical protein
LDFSGNCFPKENSWTESTTPWTTSARSTVDRRHCLSRELAEARPPAALVPESFDQGAGERKGGQANSMVGLPWLGRRWKGVSPTVELRSREDDGKGFGIARGRVLFVGLVFRVMVPQLLLLLSQ